jgi:nitrite reductase/ring-hydroxylating ferredoxin subunit
MAVSGEWVKIFLESELEEGQRKAAQASMRRMIVFRFKDKLYAIESNCPHMRFPLNDARVTEDGGIICPFHHSAFDLATGDVKEWSPWPPGIGAIAGAIRRERVLTTFPVKAEGGYIWVMPRPQNV